MILTLSEDVSLPELNDVSKVLSLEFGDLESEVSWLEGHFSGDITAADIMAHDLSSLHLGTSDTILTRWTEGEVFMPPVIRMLACMLHAQINISVEAVKVQPGLICIVCLQATKWCPCPAWTCPPLLQTP